ncbi:MAG: hypothetical protein O3C63_08855, partial [Cyanobacteria bacterium]|nr:hypothetical protein [Cyanobacteriota bacterium]
MKKRIIILVAMLALGLSFANQTTAEPPKQKGKAVKSYIYLGSQGTQLCKKLNGKTKITVCVGGEDDGTALHSKHKLTASVRDLAHKFRLNSMTLKDQEKLLLNSDPDSNADCPASLNSSDTTDASTIATGLKLCREVGDSTTVCVSGAVSGALISDKQSHWVTNTIAKLQQTYSKKFDTLSSIASDDEVEEESICEYQEGIFVAKNTSFESSKKSIAKAQKDLKAVITSMCTSPTDWDSTTCGATSFCDMYPSDPTYCMTTTSMCTSPTDWDSTTCGAT